VPPLLVRAILDSAIPQRNVHSLSVLVMMMLAVSVVSSLAGVLQTYTVTRVGQSIMSRLRVELFQNLQKMSLPFFSQTRSGEIVSRISNDVNAVQSFTTVTFVSIFSNLATIVVTLFVICTLNWRIAVLAVTVMLLLLFPIKVLGRVRHRLSRLTQEKQADLVAFLQERLNINGMMLSKTFGQGDVDVAYFAHQSKEVMELNIKQSMTNVWLMLLFGVSATAIPSLIYWFGGLLTIRGELSTGTIIAFIAYLTNLYHPSLGMANVYIDLRGAAAVFDRIFQFLDLKPEIQDKPDSLHLEDVEGHVRFQNMGFVYPAVSVVGHTRIEDEENEDSAPFELQNISFEIQPGERVALVGPSGSGKTTLTYLLSRFVDPLSGHISLDGHNLREITQESLRAHIGVVSQETFLFHASVRDNLLYARPNATMKEIEAATKAAHIDDLIRTLPKGYDTIVGERAFRLSGGEKQRLSIARTLLKDPRILILDEATSNLDANSEQIIQEALEVLMEGRTSLIIAHRLSTILSADKILVLERGKLIEMGEHKTLLAQNGLYATLYAQQFGSVGDGDENAKSVELGH
jgi:ATP-binding cassette subfamily B protein